MDRTERLGRSAEMADDTFQESMSRLSAHLSTRRPTHTLPDLLPPPRSFRIAWPYVLLVAIVGAGAVGYTYYRWLVQDDVPHPAPSHVAAAIPAPTPVLAAVAVAPEAAPPPPAVSRPAKTREAGRESTSEARWSITKATSGLPKPPSRVATRSVLKKRLATSLRPLLIVYTS